MDSIGETGSVSETHGRVIVEWKIPDIFSLSGDVHSYYESPVFCLSDSCWRLCIYPNGRKETPKWLGLFVRRQDFCPPKSMTFSLGIKRADGTQEGYKRATVEGMSKNIGQGWDEVISISDLKNRRSEVAPSGVLTVTCSLTEDSPHPTEGDTFCFGHSLRGAFKNSGPFHQRDLARTSALQPRDGRSAGFRLPVSLSTRLCSLSRDLKRMLDKGKGADFALKLKKGYELRAHRKILDARCGYFRGMLANDFQENASGVADIDDIEEGVFRCILSFLYTGEAEGMTDQNVCKIYVAADKLLLEELKRLCVYYMKENMSQDLICDVLLILEKYDDAELKERTLDNFNEHADEIFNSDGWKKFKVQNEDLVFQFLEKVIVRRMRTLKA